VILAFFKRRPRPHQPGLDTEAAELVRAAAARDLFSLLGEPMAQDHALVKVASKRLRSHLRRVATAEVDPTETVGYASANVVVLGTLSDVQDAVARSDNLHTWGHFIAPPSAHAESVAGCTGPDGVTRVYVATAWRV
jgi:hypothetical protein